MGLEMSEEESEELELSSLLLMLGLRAGVRSHIIDTSTFSWLKIKLMSKLMLNSRIEKNKIRNRNITFTKDLAFTHNLHK